MDSANLKRRVQRALSLIAARQEEHARAELLEVEKGLPDSAAAHATLAALLVRVNEQDRAVRHYQRAIELEPHNARHHFSLAATLRFMGQLEAAEECCDRALAANPNEYETYLIRSDLRRQTPERNHIGEMKRVLAGGINHYLGESMLCHALAKECEDIRAWEESFDFLTRGARARRDRLDYRVEQDVRLIDEIIRQFSRERLQAAGGKNCGDSAPIFIIGMPRTGTTLVDRILSGHSDVSSAGELPHFPQIMAEMTRAAAGSRTLAQQDLVGASLSIDMNLLGQRYLESARGLALKTRRFTDKLPFNYLNVGLIHLALPDSPIIHVTRNPMDTCYAVYKTLFQTAYPFSYDLDDLAEYFLAYSRLMRHWNEVLPGKLLQVRYEDVVAGAESEGRRMARHCSLEWQEHMARVHENREVSTTASASQIRQPIYRTSVGNWRHYERQLEPLAQKLKAAGLEIEL